MLPEKSFSHRKKLAFALPVSFGTISHSRLKSRNPCVVMAQWNTKYGCCILHEDDNNLLLCKSSVYVGGHVTAYRKSLLWVLNLTINVWLSNDSRGSLDGTLVAIRVIITLLIQEMGLFAASHQWIFAEILVNDVSDLSSHVDNFVVYTVIGQ